MNQTTYTPEELQQKVYSVVYEVSGIETSKLDNSLSISGDIAPNSLDRVTLFLALEDEFSTSVAEEKVQDIETLGDLIRFVEAQAELSAG